MEHAEIIKENTRLKAEIATLKNKLKWLERHVFGRKSEKQKETNPLQLSFDFGDDLEPVETPEYEEIAVKAHKKRVKKRPNNLVTKEGLRFEEGTPIETIQVKPEGIESLPDDQVMVRHHYKIAQNPKTYKVLHIEYHSIKRGDEIFNPPVQPAVFDKSIADVSFLAMMLLDKFLYHLPLYRQHQRLKAAGIHVSRASLVNWVTRLGQLLAPIADAQKASILLSAILAIDETPVKAGRDLAKKKMKTGCIWPMIGDQNEILFSFTPTKNFSDLTRVIGDYQGTLLTDGNTTYKAYCEACSDRTLANCWVHTRRYFERAEQDQPDGSKKALGMIGALYHIEDKIKQKKLEGVEKRDFRQTHSLPIVDQFFTWVNDQIRRSNGSSKEPFNIALNYAAVREKMLRIYLDDPDCHPDTNHLERALRVIPMGRKNWLFAWNEIGADTLCIIQSLIVTCKMQQIDPYVYLVDVLQRVGEYPASKVADLTPRRWKEKFAADPMKSLIDV